MTWVKLLTIDRKILVFSNHKITATFLPSYEWRASQNALFTIKMLFIGNYEGANFSISFTF